MAFINQIYSDHVALFNGLVSFLTTNATLVGLSQNWQIAWQAPVGAPNETDIVLRAPGLAGTDEIYVGFRLEANALIDRQAVQIYGMAGVLPSAVQVTDHVNVSNSVGFFLDNNGMEAWLCANGRRATGVIKIGTTYQSFYAGLFLPYAPPVSYPYPLAVGGTFAGTDFDNVNWTNQLSGHSAFPYPREFGIGTPSPQRSQLLCMSPDNSWVPVVNDQYNAFASNGILGEVWHALPEFAGKPEDGTLNNPFEAEARAFSFFGYGSVTMDARPALGGNYPLVPITLVRKTNGDQYYGILQGVNQVTGFDNSPENIVTIGSVDHLVVPNVFRNGVPDYFTIALE